MNLSASTLSGRQAFVLLEAILAVAIFSLGVIALGKCVSNCLAAERICSEDDIVRRLLRNRMAEIQSGAVALPAQVSESLSGPLEGMRLSHAQTRLECKNENGQDITGISVISLELSWISAGEHQSRSLAFYSYDRK